MNINNKEWLLALKNEMNQPYFQDLEQFLAAERKSGKQILPRESRVFTALEATPLRHVKAVVLGQDPYPDPEKATGLAFSIPKNKKPIASVKNMYKEIIGDKNQAMPIHGDLTHWAAQGVLLLNTTLTVEAKNPLSHKHIGWQKFTDRVISMINNKREGVVFFLWGNHAKTKKKLINPLKHCILEAAHPSPLSAHRGFFGCGHFIKCNEYLIKNNQKVIDWMP